MKTITVKVRANGLLAVQHSGGYVHAPKCVQTFHDDPSDPMFGEPYVCKCSWRRMYEEAQSAGIEALSTFNDVIMVRAGRF